MCSSYIYVFTISCDKWPHFQVSIYVFSLGCVQYVLQVRSHIDDLTFSCPGDPAWGNTYSCMNPMCASFISSIDDRKFARVKAGLQACAAENSTYRAYANWLSKWNDETLRKVYEEKCRLPYGTCILVSTIFLCGEKCYLPCGFACLSNAGNRRMCAPFYREHIL